MGRDVADAEADAAIVAAVGRRVVRDQRVMQRHLAGLDRREHRGRGVHRRADRAGAGIDGAGQRGLPVRELAPAMAAGNELHAARLDRGLRQRDPGGDVLVGREAEEGRVLVPRRDGVGVRLLDEEGAGVDQDVGAEQRFHHVEQAWILDEVARPRAAHMELAAVAGRDGAGRQRALEGLEVGAPPPRFLDGEDVDRREVAVALEGFDLAGFSLGMISFRCRWPSPMVPTSPIRRPGTP